MLYWIVILRIYNLLVPLIVAPLIHCILNLSILLINICYEVLLFYIVYELVLLLLTYINNWLLDQVRIHILTYFMIHRHIPFSSTSTSLNDNVAAHGRIRLRVIIFLYF